MKTIFDAIKNKAAYCAQRGTMFFLPSEAEQYVVKHDEEDDREYWRLEKGEQWITISYESRDTSRSFAVGPDKSIISVKGNVLQGVSFSDSWSEDQRCAM